MIALNQIHEVIIKKEREEEKQQIIYQKWKQARVNFYSNQWKNKLVQAFEPGSLCQVFGDLGQIKNVEQNQNSIEQKYRESLRRCSPIFQIIKIQLSSLRTIKIQYSQITIVNIQHIYPYSISAYQFFKVIHFNKLLAQVILKGVLVQSFQQFIKDVNLLANNKQIEYDLDQYTWMKNFSPSKGLKLSINADISFCLQNQEEAYFQKEVLEYFRLFFDEHKLLLKSQQLFIQKINGKVLQMNYTNVLNQQKHQESQYVNQYTSFLAPKLLLFDPNCQEDSFRLQRQPKFHLWTLISTLMQILVIIQRYSKALILSFQITPSLIQQQNCSSFPILPKMKTLKSIELTSTSFRKESNYMEEVIQTNLSLISIQCSAIKQEWSIGDETLNQLQVLIIRQCNRFTLSNNISSQIPSNIKCLNIQSSSITHSDYFCAIFPKLVQLTQLTLRKTDVIDQVISSIPSQKLKKLLIYNNNSITDQGVEEFDKKWPYLKILTLKGCSNITEHIFEVCRFEGLMSINAEKGILSKGNYAQQLKIRGIKVSTL